MRNGKSPLGDKKSADKKPDIRATFSSAVRAAIKVYAETGRMVDAALAYAEHNIPIFPLDIVSKAPIPARDKDANGDPIPGTGGFKKATTDPEQIRKWWWKNKRHLIGIPMGAYCGCWALDVDTNIEHDDDGVAAWGKLTAEHGEIIGRSRRHRRHLGS